MSLIIAPYPLNSCQRGGVFSGSCMLIVIPVTFTVPFILSVFGSTLLVESEGNPTNLLNSTM